MCTGPQVTDESCSFTCELGYQLLGTDNQTCLPDNTWSGEPVSCLIMSCPQLQEPLNGAIILPCPHEFRSTCNLRCDYGFYSTDILTQSCVLSADNTYVEWTQSPTCNGLLLHQSLQYLYSHHANIMNQKETEAYLHRTMPQLYINIKN